MKVLYRSYKDMSVITLHSIAGPVVCISSFTDEEEVIRRANGVQFGLSATLWTQDVSRMHRIAPQLEVSAFCPLLF